MKKTLMTIAVVFVLLLSVSSAFRSESDGMVKGGNLPLIELTDFNGELQEPSSMIDGQRFVIVNFWASSDASSRIAANRYNSYVESADKNRIQLLSINLDSNERLFREIVRMDGLNNESQYTTPQSRMLSVVERYGMSNRLQSFLIDASGKILAIDPSIETIRSLTHTI